MVLAGVGGGLLFVPLVVAATTSVPGEHAGTASGLLSTAQQAGGAAGLAALQALAGYRAPFAVAAGLAALAAVLGARLLPGLCSHP